MNIVKRESGLIKKKEQEEKEGKKMPKWFLSSRQTDTNTYTHNAFYLATRRKDKSVLKYEQKK